MKIQSLRIENFRSIKSGEVSFSSQTVLVGGNSVGKSTVCEALDLLLGPDRINRSSPIDENDFFERQYRDEEGNPITIEIEGILTNLTPDLERQYRNNLEFWNTETNSLLTEEATPEQLEEGTVIRALRVVFHGAYDIEEDEFSASTFFANPVAEEADKQPRVTRSDKRRFGFIYLRALRTGSRALSLERGSLLDIVLRLKEEDRSEMWEQTLEALEELDPPIHDIPQLKGILDEIDNRVRQFVSLSQNQPSLGLFPTALTRESLRKSITLFGASERSDTLIPYWRMGSGVVSSMVFSLLTFIADIKENNVIFAMEEPEIAIPPHTQRRIVQFLQKSMDQVLLTTHSPFVLEQFSPESVVLLSRGGDGDLSGTQLALTGIKAKTYRGSLRKHFAEALLGRGVICVEGVSDEEILIAASGVIDECSHEDEPYTPLDLSGVTVVRCDGDGGIVKHGEFFASLGLKTYAFYDKQGNADIAKQIEDTFDRCWELKQVGIERLLADEVDIDIVRAFLVEAQEWDGYPNGNKFVYSEDHDDAKVRTTCFQVLKARKGDGYAGLLIEGCDTHSMPQIIVEALDEISEDLPNHLTEHDE